MPLPFLLPLLPSIIGAAGSALGGAIGGAAAAGDKERQADLIKKILADYDGLEVPDLERIIAETQGPSAMEGVNTDPRLRGEQNSVLEKLGRLSENGDDAQTKAAMNRILTDVSRQEGAGRNAILNNMRARGTSGSGAELAAQLQNNQGAAERAQSAGLEQGAASQKRMLDALLNKGQMAGTMRGQDFSENSAKAQARDAISRYNADARSRSNYYNAGLNAQEYQMNLQKLAGKSAAARGAADQAGQSAAATGSMWNGIGGAANELGSGVAGHLAGQKTPSSASSNPYTGTYGYGTQDESDDENGTPFYLRKP